MGAFSRLVSAAVIGATVLLAGDAAADGTWYTSINGPPTHTTQGMLGMGGVIANGGVGGPGFTGGFVYGIADPADFRLQMNLAVLLGGGNTAVASIISPDFVIRPLGRRNQEANFGINLGPEIVWGASGGGAVTFGMKPGFGMSLGSPKVQFTMNMDFPIYFATAGSISGTGARGSIRPSVAVEGAIASSTNLFARVAPQILFDGGFAFIEISAGVTF
ncbi:MAG: hypothetical protein JST00_46570 [Deltaproteobacteria bacterium]|nr:hypothetical protein [Deltaproteobacteria bacterium]